MPPRIPQQLRAIAATLRSELVAATEDSTLKNRCIAASLAFQARARRAGFEVESVSGVARTTSRERRRFPWAGHVWCLYQSAVIIDLTATQFWKVPDVYVTGVASARYARELQGHSFVDEVGPKVLLRCARLEDVLDLLVKVGVRIRIECDAAPGC